MSHRLELAPGILYWPEKLGAAEQNALLDDILACVKDAPFYRPAMPRTGKPLSVEMTNFGPLGWVSDKIGGYRYQALHPRTGLPWPEIPASLIALWTETTRYPAPPEACLVNLYRTGTRMGLHRDEDEKAIDAPLLSLSLGDTALFRFAKTEGPGPTQTLKLNSGDVLMFGPPARFIRHGVDRIEAGGSSLIPGGGRINLTLRRVNVVNPEMKSGRPGGWPTA